MVKLTDKCLSTVRISKRQFGIVRHLHNLHTYYKYPCTYPILKDSSFTIFMFDSSANAADNSKHGKIFPNNCRVHDALFQPLPISKIV